MIQPFGEAALLVEVGDWQRSHALLAALDHEPIVGVVDLVPGMATLLVELDPSANLEIAAAELERRLANLPGEAPSGRERVIPTCYGGEFGLDLDDVARLTGLSSDEVVASHASAPRRVHLIGFAPGFAYIGDLPEALRVPRLETPRTTTPPGSVAVAGRQTGIYPAALPGGWRVIGRTPIRLFDPHRDPPAYLAPGDLVRFQPILPTALQAHAGIPADWPGRQEPDSHPSEPSRVQIEVLDGGLLTTVQDATGRPGWRRYGVQAAGAADRSAALLANRLAGNPDAAAVLEVTFLGPSLRISAPVHVGLAGADLGATLDGRPLPPGSSGSGRLISFGERRSGARAYVAIAGGIDVERVLGSPSTDLRSGFGGLAGRALRAGDRLDIGTASGASRAATGRAATGPIRIMPGPHLDRFAPGILDRLCETAWTVASQADRMGYRLDGPAVEHNGTPEVPSVGLPLGAVQVPPDGRPIIMLVDRPVTGGYPVIGCVPAADVCRVAQLLPGDPLRFARMGIGEAMTLDADAAWAGALE
ncbi:MAG: 5-oxoprolinase subunit PxpB [Chloroflexota bacterium]|nr:5-oxoprolinase subunit PxpB [Chloroflexota bacterium]